MMLRVTPQMFEGSVARVVELIESWDWEVQPWGQETLTEGIRRILQNTENGLRHIGDILAGRHREVTCGRCRRHHDGLVCHIDVKSTTRSYDRQTGRLALEIHSWQALRNETRTTVPAILVFEPFRDCPAERLLWIPAIKLDPEDMRVGPGLGNGSGDPYFLLAAEMCRRIDSLQCWDGWS